MKAHQLLSMMALLLTASVSSQADSPVKATVADLNWMTGSWAGPIGGEQTLEENWIQPTDGSIASLVRITGNGSTSMVELIVVEEENDTLVLRIKQWDPGFSPRTPGPQKMVLTAISDHQVSFTAAEPGGMKSLTYTRPADDIFTIGVENSEGAKFEITLKAR